LPKVAASSVNTAMFIIASIMLSSQLPFAPLPVRT
jgi:hypothetical protein